MSEAAWGFAPLPFQAEEALQRLHRELRELGLQERAGCWERRGLAIARISLDSGAIQASRVKKPSRNSPQWVLRNLKSSADVRDFTGDLKKQLAQWSDDHD